MICVQAATVDSRWGTMDRSMQYTVSIVRVRRAPMRPHGRLHVLNECCVAAVPSKRSAAAVGQFTSHSVHSISLSMPAIIGCMQPHYSGYRSFQALHLST